MLEKCKWNCWRKVVVIATAEVGNKVSLALENTLFCQIRTTGMWGRQRRWFWSFLYVPSLEFMKVRSDLCLGGIPWCILWRWWRSRCWCLQGQRAMWRNHLPGRQQSEKVGESWHCIFKMSLSGHWSLGVPFYCLLNCSRLLSVEFVLLWTLSDRDAAAEELFMPFLPICSRCRAFPLIWAAGFLTYLQHWEIKMDLNRFWL